MPAELAVLRNELKSNEVGVWLNSRGLVSGVAELERIRPQSFRTRRIPLPDFVATGLAEIYEAAQVAKGCPDLVIWRTDRASFRLVEVKCPRWDTPTHEQELFIGAASERGVPARIVEWLPDDGAA